MTKKVEKKEKISKKNMIMNEVNEFKKFISRGNVVDMAVGVIVGGAFGKIVTSLVNDVLMPLIGTVMGGINFSDLSIKIKDANIAYGLFVQSVVDFLIIAMCIFAMVKVFERFKHKEEEKVAPKPAKTDEVKLLEEIRDLLKDKRK